MQPPTFIIAEAGVNHNGSLEMALELIEVAARSGANAVKFQTFKAEKLLSRTAPKASYQVKTTSVAESQFDMIKKLELSDAAHETLNSHCRRHDIQFLSTPFDLESIDLLAHRFDLPVLKMPSGEITNALLLLAAARTRKPIILSTGMSDLADIEQALGVLAFGFLGWDAPSLHAFRDAYASGEGQRLLREKVTLLHCTTEYPAPLDEVNLYVMDTLQAAFGLRVGYSDHTEGIDIPIAAVARGATIIEKHFTLDRALPGPDHRASLEPQELAAMIKAIRSVEQALGHGRKIATPAEQKNRPIARKSLVAARPIRRGDVFTTENLAVKRPGSGISPLHYWDWLGKTADRDYPEDSLVGV
jgi:N-acetylneuraminate synthase